MRKELNTYLRERYPQLYVRDGRSISFDCGDGWFNILLSLSESIQAHVDRQVSAYYNSQFWEQVIANKDVKNYPYWYLQYADDPTFDFKKSMYYKAEKRSQPTVDQIKEKFGTLRFYMTGSDNVIEGMVGVAESMSAITCEECGNAGKLRDKGWIRTLCDIHAAQEGKEVVGPEIKVGDKRYVLFNHLLQEAEIIELLENDEFKVKIKVENYSQRGYDKDVESDLIITEEVIVKRINTPQITYFIALEKN